MQQSFSPATNNFSNDNLSNPLLHQFWRFLDHSIWDCWSALALFRRSSQLPALPSSEWRMWILLCLYWGILLPTNRSSCMFAKELWLSGNVCSEDTSNFRPTFWRTWISSFSFASSCGLWMNLGSSDSSRINAADLFQRNRSLGARQSMCVRLLYIILWFTSVCILQRTFLCWDLHGIGRVWWRTLWFVTLSAQITHRLLFGGRAFCDRFWQTLRHLLVFLPYRREYQEWLQECTCCVIKLNNCVNCNHLSRLHKPLVKMSAICWELLAYLIWILGSMFIRSNNQSRFTLWVREMCLMVGNHLASWIFQKRKELPVGFGEVPTKKKSRRSGRRRSQGEKEGEGGPKGRKEEGPWERREGSSTWQCRKLIRPSVCHMLCSIWW